MSASNYYGFPRPGIVETLFFSAFPTPLSDKTKWLYDTMDKVANGELAFFMKGEEITVCPDTYLNRMYYWANGYSRNPNDDRSLHRISEYLFCGSVDFHGVQKGNFLAEMGKYDMDGLRARLVTRFSL